MPRRKDFFTPEMGARLRQIRERAELTQDQVAARMGLTGKGRRMYVSKLESGRVHRPYLDTVTGFLIACGGLFSEFYDLLTRVKPVPVDTTPIEQTDWPEQRKELVKERTKDQVFRFQRRVEQPYLRRPMMPESRKRAVEGFREYQVQMNVIEEAVRQFLTTTQTTVFDYQKYYLCARKTVGLLRREQKRRAREEARGAKGREGRLQIEDCRVQSQSTPHPNPLPQGERESSSPASSSDVNLETVTWFAEVQNMDLGLVEQVKAIVVREFERLQE